MPELKAVAEKVRAKFSAVRRVAKRAGRRHAGTDIEAFYAAQQEAALDSREYAARRRQR
jgi:hypothetical protein